MASGTTKHLLNILIGKPYKPAPQGEFTPRLTPYWNLNTIEEYCLEAHEFLRIYPDYAYYLRKRGIADLVGELTLGYADGYYVFPIRDRKRNIIGAIGRAGECKSSQGAPRYAQPNGQHGQLYIPSFGRIESASKIYCPFGIIDGLTLYQMGYAVAIFTSGKDMRPELFAEYRKQIVLIPDQGEETSGRRLWAKLGWRGSVITPSWPEGTKDCNDVFVKCGEDSLRKIINA
jgi:hypothetical protein